MQRAAVDDEVRRGAARGADRAGHPAIGKRGHDEGAAPDDGRSGVGVRAGELQGVPAGLREGITVAAVADDAGHGERVGTASDVHRAVATERDVAVHVDGAAPGPRDIPEVRVPVLGVGERHAAARSSFDLHRAISRYREGARTKGRVVVDHQFAGIERDAAVEGVGSREGQVAGPIFGQ